MVTSLIVFNPAVTFVAPQDIYWKFEYQNLWPGGFGKEQGDYIIGGGGYSFSSHFTIWNDGPYTVFNDDVTSQGEFYIDYQKPPDRVGTFRAYVPPHQYSNDDLVSGHAQQRGNTWRASITAGDPNAYIINFDEGPTNLGSGTSREGYSYTRWRTSSATHYSQWMNEEIIIKLEPEETEPKANWLTYLPEIHTKPIQASSTVFITDRNKLIKSYRVDVAGNPV